VNTFFWRNYDKAEVDYLEDANGRLEGFECKWQTKRWRPPVSFIQAYPEAQLHVVDPQNYVEFLT